LCPSLAPPARAGVVSFVVERKEIIHFLPAF
jgi:hypothetical protein